MSNAAGNCHDVYVVWATLHCCPSILGTSPHLQEGHAFSTSQHFLQFLLQEPAACFSNVPKKLALSNTHHAAECTKGTQGDESNR